jgi:hypothetical protein
VYKILVGKPVGKRALEKQRIRWEDGIRIDCREIGWWGVEWIQLAQDTDQLWALMNTLINRLVLVPHI